MLAKKIKYEDYDGIMREDEFQFNLSQADVIKLLTTTGEYTLDKLLKRLSTERNGKKIMEIFEDILKMSYGRKSLDGKRFEKSEELWKEFYETEAYSVLFTELVTDAKKAAEFINAIIPKKLADNIADIVKNNPDGIPDELKDYILDDNQGKVVEMPTSK